MLFDAHLRGDALTARDVADGRVVKGTNFVDLTDEGDPPELAERYAREGADEIVLTDIYSAGEDAIPGVTIEALAEVNDESPRAHLGV